MNLERVVLTAMISEIACAAFPALRPLSAVSRAASAALLAEALLRPRAR